MVDDLLRLILANLSGASSSPIVLTGTVGVGKTRAAREVVPQLQQRGYQVGGVISPRIMNSGKTLGYDVVDLSTGESSEFVRSGPPGERVGRFFLRSAGLKFAREVVEQAIVRCNPVFIDEVGRLELNGRGLAPCVSNLLDSDKQGIYLVRERFLSRFLKVFEIPQCEELKIKGETS